MLLGLRHVDPGSPGIGQKRIFRPSFAKPAGFDLHDPASRGLLCALQSTSQSNLRLHPLLSHDGSFDESLALGATIKMSPGTKGQCHEDEQADGVETKLHGWFLAPRIEVEHP